MAAIGRREWSKESTASAAWQGESRRPIRQLISRHAHLDEARDRFECPLGSAPITAWPAADTGLPCSSDVNWLHAQRLFSVSLVASVKIVLGPCAKVRRDSPPSARADLATRLAPPAGSTQPPCAVARLCSTRSPPATRLALAVPDPPRTQGASCLRGTRTHCLRSSRRQRRWHRPRTSARPTG
jgi:hypothetical protein